MGHEPENHPMGYVEEHQIRVTLYDFRVSSKCRSFPIDSEPVLLFNTDLWMLKSPYLPWGVWRESAVWGLSSTNAFRVVGVSNYTQTHHIIMQHLTNTTLCYSIQPEKNPELDS